MTPIIPTIHSMTKSSCFSFWLDDKNKTTDTPYYTHLLLKEDLHKRPSILKELKRVINNAHEDSKYRLRQIIKEIAFNDLDPLEASTIPPTIAGYPEKLHISTLKGYFGEIFAGIVAENFSPFDFEDWEVPVFLFRYHETVFEQLEDLNWSGQPAAPRPGRTGDDCLAFQRDTNGKIIRYLYCEAKCTDDHQMNLIHDAHRKLSNGHPTNIRNLIEILKSYADPRLNGWITALQELYFRINDSNYAEQCDLLVYVCGKSPAGHGGRTTWIQTNQPHAEYTATRKFEAVEIHLKDVDNLVKEVYQP